ncbi:MAG: type IV pilus assembly protein FimV [Psychrobacter sp.]|uniref:type IV pilus assembly protein FimV n=1 Tax=unclassified Psychrobacter TaxID=196806 RepID=UPI001787E127|nr:MULTISPECIES: peptigoglycan-binding protein LysM [unclassified Psychrobacter]MBE0442234.1 peptigoglycan-binding protein LysM [Psychrobacter sp. FME13]
MSRHLSHRFTTIHRAVSTALLYSVGYAALISGAQAATIGKTVVTSAQHEPLAASITVTNIRASDFSASLANSAIYQRMGLTKTDSMNVRFQPTSATSGQVFITTSQPVSKPFTDVVLSINDQGKSNVVPKTLLMPLNDSVPIETPKNTVTAAKKPNLPSVSASTAEPLTLKKGMPPPLISAPSSSTTELIASKLPAPNMQLPAVASTSQGSDLTNAPSRLDNGRLGAANTSETATNSNSNDIDSSDVANNTPATKAAAPALDFDILNIQVTRQIQPRGKSDAGMMITDSKIPAIDNDETNASKPSLDTNNTTAPSSNIPADTAMPAAPNGASSATSNTATAATAQYQVQRNDSLWIIAQQIAEENNLDVSTVMKQIQAQNPNAFINKDADQLKADAKLSLPRYDVIPSQQKLEAAIKAQRQHSRRANTPVVKKKTKPTANKSPKKSQATTQNKKPMITKTQTLPKAQFSVLAPGHNGSADGTQTKSTAATGNGLSTDILATLKASRQSVASQAQRLSKTSSALESYTQKIQLQNQKLAELQARLKKLRNQ